MNYIEGTRQNDSVTSEEGVVLFNKILFIIKTVTKSRTATV